jgi:WD40 repeat protein
VWSVSYSANGAVLASGGGDERVVLWDVASALQASAQSALQPSAAVAGAPISAPRTSPTVSEAAIAGVFATKKTPVSFVKFSRRNFLFAAGAVQ